MVLHSSRLEYSKFTVEEFDMFSSWYKDPEITKAVFGFVLTEEMCAERFEKAMKINIDHPGANHYSIHMVELPKPELGVTSAERLGQTMPGAGHIVHMPGHIYMRVGRYADAVKVNQDAVLADESYISQCYSQGLYPLGYYPHNIHFLWSAASMLGDSKLAIEAAKKTAEKVPFNILKSSMTHQNFASTPLLVIPDLENGMRF